jgi:hypothetical protein
MKKIIPLVFYILSFAQTNASHILGSDISYTWIGPGVNTYRVNLNLYRDCDGLAMATTEDILVKSTCGNNFQFSVALLSASGSEISQFCPASLGLSTCNGGILIGVQYYQYQGIVNLPSTCPNWTFSWTQCCRNNTINVPGSPSDDIYIEANLNLSDGGQNNSPFYNSQPGFYVNVNQGYNFDIGVFESDGDSLKHELIAAQLTSTTNVNYGPGYSALQPIPGITIDAHTGLLGFTPTAIGNFIIAVKTTEYNSLGQLKGSVIKDFEILVLNGTNQHPDINSGVISNLSPNASINGNGEIEICGNNTLMFEATYTDLDTADILSITTNLDAIVGNNNYSYTVLGTNPLSVTYTLQIPSNMSDFSFISTINDNSCPGFAFQNYQYNIKVIQSISSLQDQIVCGTDATQLNVAGGSIFTWYDLSGNIIPVDASFSCNPCANPIISPNTTTTYIVQSDILNGCTNTDTVIVFHSNDVFTVSLLSDTNTCLNTHLTMNPVLSTPGNYTHQWAPDSLLSNTTMANPHFLANYPGSFWIYNNVTNSSGCISKDSIQITVSSNSQFNTVASSDTVCIGSANQLAVNVSLNSASSICGMANNVCQNGLQMFEIGQDSLFNFNSTYPSIFGNFYWGAKHQMLYKAAELTAMGASAGSINAVSFYVSSLNTSSPNYSNVNIQLKCSQIDSLNTLETGLTSMLTLPIYHVQLGWNTFNFNNPYNWNGTSNLIVQFCFNNVNWTSNCSNTYTVTPFNSVLYFHGDMNNVCQSAIATVSNQRPNIKFGFCPPTFSPNEYTFNWSPSGYLNNSTIYNPLTTVPNAGTYQVIVTDIVGGCSDTATVLAQNNGVVGALIPVISYNNNTLSTAPAYAYQWFYNGVAIAGADSASIVPVLNGDYTVQIFDSTVCSAFSAPYTVNVTNVNINDANSIQIFPNPANNFIDIKINGTINKYLVQIIGIDGSQVKEVLVDKTDRIQLDNMDNGVYFIKIKNTNNNNFERTRKLIILH